MRPGQEGEVFQTQGSACDVTPMRTQQEHRRGIRKKARWGGQGGLAAWANPDPRACRVIGRWLRLSGQECPPLWNSPNNSCGNNEVDINAEGRALVG